MPTDRQASTAPPPLPPSAGRFQAAPSRVPRYARWCSIFAVELAIVWVIVNLVLGRENPVIYERFTHTATPVVAVLCLIGSGLSFAVFIAAIVAVARGRAKVWTILVALAANAIAGAGPTVGRTVLEARQGVVAIDYLADLQQLEFAMLLYTTEHDGFLSDDSYRHDDLARLASEETGDEYLDRFRLKGEEREMFRKRIERFAFNRVLKGKRIVLFLSPSRQVQFFECAPGHGPTGTREDLAPRPMISRDGYLIGFLDGHVDIVPPEKIDELKWETREARW